MFSLEHSLRKIRDEYIESLIRRNAERKTKNVATQTILTKTRRRAIKMLITGKVY